MSMSSDEEAVDFPQDGLLSYLVADQQYSECDLTAVTEVRSDVLCITILHPAVTFANVDNVDPVNANKIAAWKDVRGSAFPTYTQTCAAKQPQLTADGVSFASDVLISDSLFDLFSTPGATVVLQFNPVAATGGQQFIPSSGS
jgi:hypothetical protein